MKFVAIALCAAALLAAAAGGFGILVLTEAGLYTGTVQDYHRDRLEDVAYSYAQNVAQRYACIEIGGCPEDMVSSYHYFNSGTYGYVLKDDTGRVLERMDLASGTDTGNVMVFTQDVSGSYMKVVGTQPAEPQVEATAPEEALAFHDVVYDANNIVYGIQVWQGPDGVGGQMERPIGYLYHDEAGYLYFHATTAGLFDLSDEPITGIEFQDYDGEPLYYIEDSGPVGEMTKDENGYWHFTAAYPTAPEIAPMVATEAAATEPGDDWAEVHTYHDHDTVIEYVWEVMPVYTVDVFLLPNATGNQADYLAVETIYSFRNILPTLLAAGLLVFAVTAVYLCCAAGRKPGSDELHPAGLNRLPLDLYLAGICTALLVLAVVGYEGGEALLRGNVTVGIGFALLTGYLMALSVVAFCFACAAQFKLRQGYWWRHMLLGRCLSQGLRFLRWVAGGLKFAVRGCRAMFRLLPVIWQWLLTALLMVTVPFIALIFFVDAWHIWEIFWGLVLLLTVLADIAMVCYGAWCFGTLMKGAKTMAQGNLNYHIPTGFMIGAFRDFGVQLNSLADAAHLAAEKQLKSERMKTELITNVSHDTKTPLTSIINFVDLLKKPHDEAQGAEYLDVLDRQSQRLKKLIDDLMEMSKASTGNMTVELGQVDAAEAINQALGEFSDKLDAAGLVPVFRGPDSPVIMQADGRLVWRVLSNLLNNAVKYALPDTRLYIDLMVLQGNAVIAIKNISREQLNLNAEELMERFVRGDASRNTEGSGLGLNIAKSLVENQKGQMHLMVDGDLFKVTLIFPLA